MKDGTDRTFTLQNGASVPGEVFSDITKKDYKDSLAVTDLNDLADYIYSLQSMTALSSIPRDAIKETLSRHMKDGILTVPKEYGMFISK